MADDGFEEEEIDDASAAASRQYISIVENDDARGLDLLRKCREALADLYAVVIRVPSLAISPAMTSPINPMPIPFEGEIESLMAERIPKELYWSALRPLTWETVGDVGVKRLARALVDIWRVVAPIMRGSAAESPYLLLHSFALDKDDLAQLTLAALTILQEVVTDLEAYERA